MSRKTWFGAETAAPRVDNFTDFQRRTADGWQAARFDCREGFAPTSMHRDAGDPGMGDDQGDIKR